MIYKAAVVSRSNYKTIWYGYTGNWLLLFQQSQR
jgi:hypothetical protein